MHIFLWQYLGVVKIKSKKNVAAKKRQRLNTKLKTKVNDFLGTIKIDS
jgi:hypothetical protein